MTDGGTGAPAIRILPAEARDLREILELQYLAYQSEAKLLNNPAIPPLRETLSEMERQHEAGLILKAVDAAGVIVGSVRGRADDGTLHVGKLMVRPDLQGRGIGRRLLAEIEARLPLPRCELFTSDKSAGNLSLYEALGYRRFREEEVASGLRLVYLEKHRTGEEG